MVCLSLRPMLKDVSSAANPNTSNVQSWIGLTLQLFCIKVTQITTKNRELLRLALLSLCIRSSNRLSVGLEHFPLKLLTIAQKEPEQTGAMLIEAHTELRVQPSETYERLGRGLPRNFL